MGEYTGINYSQLWWSDNWQFTLKTHIIIESRWVGNGLMIIRKILRETGGWQYLLREESSVFKYWDSWVGWKLRSRSRRVRLIFQFNHCVITAHNHPVPLIIHLTPDPTRCNGPEWKLLSGWIAHSNNVTHRPWPQLTLKMTTSSQDIYDICTARASHGSLTS